MEILWVGFSVSPNKSKKEGLYVGSYIEKFIRIYSQFEHNIWSCFYDGVYSICDYLYRSW